MKRESVDNYIKRLKEDKNDFAQCKRNPINFFHVLLDCPHSKLPRVVVAEYISNRLNAIYQKDSNAWQVVNYSGNIILAFGKYGYCPPLYYECNENEYVSYKRLNGYDCVSIDVQENTFYEAEYSANKIFSDLKKAGF